jgi:organic radical activating enzyme
MYISELVLEITRRCNVQCRHCLRGRAQPVDMSLETLAKALKGVTSIGTITFTGGEPSLRPQIIRRFTRLAKKNKISVDSFFVVTNGKIASVDLMLALAELYAYCSGEKGQYFVGGLEVSQDQFHREKIRDIRKALELYGALTFFHPEERKKDITDILDEGMAFKNGIGITSADRNTLVVETYEDGTIYANEGVVYVNALGDVIDSCNLSYESQKESKIGSVHENTLEEILTRLIPKEEPELQEVA